MSVEAAVTATSECDRAGVCQYDRACPFYAQHCRHDPPPEPKEDATT